MDKGFLKKGGFIIEKRINKSTIQLNLQQKKNLQRRKTIFFIFFNKKL